MERAEVAEGAAWLRWRTFARKEHKRKRQRRRRGRRGRRAKKDQGSDRPRSGGRRQAKKTSCNVSCKAGIAHRLKNEEEEESWRERDQITALWEQKLEEIVE